MPGQQPKVEALYRGLEEELRAQFSQAGWTVAEDHRVDFIVDRDGRKFAVELKAVRQARTPALEGAFAAAYLRAKKHAGRSAKPAVAVGAPALSPKARAHIRAFAKAYAPKAALILMDERGLFEAHGIDLPSRRASTEDDVPSVLDRPQSVNLFSDLNRWLLKLLIAPRLPKGLGPEVEGAIVSSTALAKRGLVSIPTAHRLTKRLRGEGFLARKRELELVRVPELLIRWQREPVPGGASDLPIRFVLKKSLARRLAAVKKKTDQRACLALFSAARSMGFRFVSDALVHLDVERVDTELLEALGAVPAQEGRVDAYLRVPAHPESVFRAAIERDGMLATDIIQTWLDVSQHPTRGAEQAARIWRKIFEPSFGPVAL